MPVFLKDVEIDLLKFGRNADHYPKYKTKNLESLPAPGTNSIMFKTVVLGEKDNYTTYIQFFKVDFQEAKAGDFVVPAKIGSSVLYHKKPSTDKNPVFLYCSCQDFRYRFSKPLYDSKGLLGNWQRYKRVTPEPPVGYPHVNPDNRLGYCKHISSMILDLKAKGQVVD